MPSGQVLRAWLGSGGRGRSYRWLALRWATDTVVRKGSLDSNHLAPGPRGGRVFDPLRVRVPVQGIMRHFHQQSTAPNQAQTIDTLSLERRGYGPRELST